MAPVILTKLVLPADGRAGRGVVDQPGLELGDDGPARSRPGSGGWGLGYGMSKAALHRMAGMLAVELGDRGIRAYNLSPGFIATERIAIDMARVRVRRQAGAPADVVGAVAAWLVTAPGRRHRNGGWVEAQDVCRELGLLPGWP